MDTRHCAAADWRSTPPAPVDLSVPALNSSQRLLPLASGCSTAAFPWPTLPWRGILSIIEAHSRRERQDRVPPAGDQHGTRGSLTPEGACPAGVSQPSKAETLLLPGPFEPQNMLLACPALSLAFQTEAPVPGQFPFQSLKLASRGQRSGVEGTAHSQLQQQAGHGDLQHPVAQNKRRLPLLHDPDSVQAQPQAKSKLTGKSTGTRKDKRSFAPVGIAKISQAGRQLPVSEGKTGRQTAGFQFLEGKQTGRGHREAGSLSPQMGAPAETLLRVRCCRKLQARKLGPGQGADGLEGRPGGPGP